MFDSALVCARCQPPTRAHFAAVAAARSLARRVLFVVLNADDATSPANPFDNDTRRALLRAGGIEDDVEIVMLRDRRYAPARWAAAAAALIDGRVTVIADRDAASTSLPLPATWVAAEVETEFAAAEAAARTCLLEAQGPDWARLAALVPAAELAALRALVGSADFARLTAEALFLGEYRAAWHSAPFPPVFVTVDSVATWRDRVLLIERGRLPGRGLWALPGGFIDLDETLANACLRELEEETGIVIEASAVRDHRVFDDPLRSQRGRTVTHAYRFVLDHLPSPPLAVGADDAVAAAWVPLTDLRPERLFDDHYFILQSMLALD